MESLKNNNEMDMFYMYVIPGFSIKNESESNFVCRIIKFVFQNFETILFIFDHTLFTDLPFLLTKLLTQPFLQIWNFFYPTLRVGSTQWMVEYFDL